MLGVEIPQLQHAVGALDELLHARFRFAELLGCQAKELDSRAIGLVLAVPMLMRPVSVPVIARAADRWNALRGVLIAASIGSTLAYLLLSQATGFVAILLAVALASLALAPGMPLTDAYALKGLASRGRAYGPVRLWGSVAFVAANLGGGFIIDRIAPIRTVDCQDCSRALAYVRYRHARSVRRSLRTEQHPRRQESDR